MTITYTTGDATRPVGGGGPKIIAHICNDEGKWGRGFVVALSRRNAASGILYKKWHTDGAWEDPDFGTASFALGQVQFLAYEQPGTFLANMIAQRGVRHGPSQERAVQYDALAKCLYRLSEFALLHGRENALPVHMPRIGCGLGGGSWDEIEPIINDTLVSRGIPVTVYDLPGKGG